MGASYPKLLDSAPRVVILGGGFGGAEVAKSLDASGQFNVLLIDRKSYFFNNCAAVRTTVEDKFAAKIFVPYTKLLKHGSFLQAEIEEINVDSVRVRGYSNLITFEYLVIALGSQAPFPGKFIHKTRSEALEQYNEMYSIVQNCSSISIVGSGATAIEMAGEIATDLPHKKLRVITSTSSILDKNLKVEYKDRVTNILKKMNVEFIYDEKVILTEEQKELIKAGKLLVQKNGKIKTEKGTEYEQDLVLICTGMTIANELLNSHFSECLNDEGRLKVNNSLQISNVPKGNIFALGDIAGNNPKSAFLAKQQGNVVSNNIQLLHNNKEKEVKEILLKEFKPFDKAVSFLALGRKSGLGLYGDSIYGEWMITFLKSKTLGVEKVWKFLNLTEEESIKAAADNNDLNACGLEGQNIKIKNFQKFIETDEKTATEMLKHGINALHANASSSSANASASSGSSSSSSSNSTDN